MSWSDCVNSFEVKTGWTCTRNDAGLGWWDAKTFILPFKYDRTFIIHQHYSVFQNQLPTYIQQMASTILISGAASGLGLAFLIAYAVDESNTIIAVDKNPLPQGLATKATIHQHLVDVTSESSILQLAKSLSNIPINIVIHSAGIRGLVHEAEEAHPDDVAACETLPVMNLETLMKTFQINAAGTFLLLRALLPNLLLSTDSKVVVMSSRMGSVGHNSTGSAYAYRASKAALNAMVRSMSVDVPEVDFILCHPGRVETNLVRCREEGAVSAEESVEGLLPLIAQWGKKDSGQLYDRFGHPIVW